MPKPNDAPQERGFIIGEREYQHLKSTVYVLRGSGAPLTAEQEESVKKFEGMIQEYENHWRNHPLN